MQKSSLMMLLLNSNCKTIGKIREVMLWFGVQKNSIMQKEEGRINSCIGKVN